MRVKVVAEAGSDEHVAPVRLRHLNRLPELQKTVRELQAQIERLRAKAGAA